MFNSKKVIVVLPAYNAEKTLEKTIGELDRNLVDDIVLVDDFSTDNTLQKAKELGIQHAYRHEKNNGYGGNQKTCYSKALELDADIIVMLHPDYQYTPLLMPAIVSIIGNGLYPVVFGSRILGKGALKGGMPYYKYVANRVLTFIQNVLMNQKLGEYHTGYRAYSREVLESINYHKLSNDFIFDNQIIAQIFHKDYEIAEITCPTKYFEEASSINFSRSVTYGLGVLKVSFLYFLDRIGLIRWKLLK
jgi:glycosyltransferase involved in cell wall biosynthesis